MAQDTYIFLPEIRPFPEGRGPKGELTRQEFETLTRTGIVLFTDNTNRTSGKTPIPHHFPLIVVSLALNLFLKPITSYKRIILNQ